MSSVISVLFSFFLSFVTTTYDCMAHSPPPGESSSICEGARPRTTTTPGNAASPSHSLHFPPCHFSFSTQHTPSRHRQVDGFSALAFQGGTDGIIIIARALFWEHRVGNHGSAGMCFGHGAASIHPPIGLRAWAAVLRRFLALFLFPLDEDVRGVGAEEDMILVPHQLERMKEQTSVD